MSVPPRLEVKIPPATVRCDASLKNSPDSPASTPVSSNCSTPSSVDGLLNKFRDPEKNDNGVQPNLSTLHLLVIHIGAALTLFLATTDATIVSTSLPTISSHLKASSNEYTWVGVAYMLTQTAFQPLYGRLSDLLGRKNILYSSIAIFAIGSALCGSAQSITWLISSRALAGIGGGGIVSAVWIITSEIVEVRRRAIWSQALSVTWSCSAVAGPLIGGLFSGQGNATGWRWGFYLNIPICVVSFFVLFFSLRGVDLNPPAAASWRSLKQCFDFIGLFLFMSATSCIIVGFSFATDVGWGTPMTLLPIIIGVSVLIGGGFYENYRSRDSLFPPTAFRDVTTAAILLISFLHNFAFNSGTFYLALFYQAVDGSSPIESGLKILPYSLGASLASIPVAWFVAYWQKQTHDTSGLNRVISAGLFISSLGFGLLILLDENSSKVSQTIYPLIAGIGIGMLFHAPYQIFIRALKPHEIATGTSAFFLVRFTGATIGLSVAGTTFYSRANVPDLRFYDSSPSIDFSKIKYLSLARQKEVIHIIATSIRTIWIVCVPCLCFSILISLFLKTMPCPDPMMVVETPSSEENLQPQGSPKKRWPLIFLFSRTVDRV